MFTDAALLQAICQEPDDNDLRLIYADWIEEQGEPERAEFIRVQVELVRCDNQERRSALLARLHAFERLREEWRAALPHLFGVTWGPLVRGFVESVSVQRWRYYRASAAVLWNATPVRSFSFGVLGIDQCARFFQEAEVLRLRELSLTTEAPPGRIFNLLRSTRKHNLRILSLTDLTYARAVRGWHHQRLDGEDLRPLLRSAHLECFEQIRLMGYSMSAGEREALHQRFGPRLNLDYCSTVVNQG